MADHNWRQAQGSAQTSEDILDALDTFIREKGHSPTRAELAEAVGVSKQTVTRHVRALIEEGRLEEGAGPRTLRFPV